MNEYIKNHQEDFDKTIEHFKNELNNLRVGRANPSTIESVLVDSYGVKTPLVQVSSIAVPDARSMTVEPWDKNLLKDIEKALTLRDTGPTVEEKKSKIWATKSLVLESSMLKGDIIKEQSLVAKRPGSGISPSKINDVIGKKINNNLEKDSILQWKHIQ